MKQNRTLTLFTRTPLHVGAGSTIGAIDLPVIRERHTKFPVIPGSSIKGVLRDYATGQLGLSDVQKLFGRDPESKSSENGEAGAISFGEARLLAFPVRSAKGAFALATCPLTLARFARDTGKTYPVPQVADNTCLASAAIRLEGNKVALEEYVFAAQGDFPADWAACLSSLLDDVVLQAAKTHIVLLSDGDFAHFAQNACQVQHHNRIDDTTGTVVDGALFNIETVPSETLFYAPLHVVREGCDDNALFRLLAETERLLQFGGHSTTGLGFCTCKLS